jgi:hypothetical protein
VNVNVNAMARRIVSPQIERFKFEIDPGSDRQAAGPRASSVARDRPPVPRKLSQHDSRAAASGTSRRARAAAATARGYF